MHSRGTNWLMANWLFIIPATTVVFNEGKTIESMNYMASLTKFQYLPL